MKRAPDKQLASGMVGEQLGTGSSSAVAARLINSTSPEARPATGAWGTAAKPRVASEVIAILWVESGSVTRPLAVSLALFTTSNSFWDGLNTIVSWRFAETAIRPGEGPAPMAETGAKMSFCALTITNPGVARLAEMSWETKARN